ncbi:hypothetical protein B9Y78_08080 [Stenotrophomonas maltophilia]|nr:hypothetical protein B9Y78_08080 [Stenotrophomonas maltophilia]
MALGFVPAGMGRDLLEYLYWPDGAILRGAAIYQGVVRVAMKEWATRMQAHTDARCTYGLAETLAKYAKDRSPATVRNLAILQARVAVARDNLWPEKLEDKLPMLVPMLLRAMKGEKHSNVDRAKAMGINESSYRERWSKVYEWMLTKMIDEEQAAARAMEQALRNEAA